jgi:hypothetical protein
MFHPPSSISITACNPSSLKTLLVLKIFAIEAALGSFSLVEPQEKRRRIRVTDTFSRCLEAR